jgi:hypothetical protein
VNIDRFLKVATSHAENVRVTRTGINPLLFLVALVSLPALILSVVVRESWLSVALLGFAGLPILVTIVAYFVLVFRRPELLQSEEYRLKLDALRIIYKRGVSPEALKATSEIAHLETVTGRKRNGEKQ